MWRIRHFFEALFLGIVAIIACALVILAACWQYVFKPKGPTIRYVDKEGKVVNLDDFKATKARREL